VSWRFLTLTICLQDLMSHLAGSWQLQAEQQGNTTQTRVTYHFEMWPKGDSRNNQRHESSTQTHHGTRNCLFSDMQHGSSDVYVVVGSMVHGCVSFSSLQQADGADMVSFSMQGVPPAMLATCLWCRSSLWHWPPAGRVGCCESSCAKRGSATF